MPATWQFRDSVLVVTLGGEYAFEDPIRAVTDAMNNPRFHPGISLLIDAHESKARPSADDIRVRANWITSLVPRGVSRRCAVVVSTLPHHYGLARMLGIHLDLQNIALEIFTGFEEAMRWLTAETAQGAGE